MTSLTESMHDETPQTNSIALIPTRAYASRIQWAGPLLVIFLRPVLFFVVQGLLAIVFFAAHQPSPWHQAGQWWNVYGTVVDLGCLVGIRFFTLKEGIKLLDLVGPIKLRFGRDIFAGLGLFVVTAPIFLGGSVLVEVILYGSFAKIPAAFLMQGHALPLWGLLYSLTAWWMLSSATEEVTYQGYALPRLQALTGRTWLAVLIVAFCWNAQHCILPFVLDGKYLLVRFLGFVPGIFVFLLVYLRTRRLAPLIVAHWCMDILGAAMGAIW